MIAMVVINFEMEPTLEIVSLLKGILRLTSAIPKPEDQISPFELAIETDAPVMRFAIISLRMNVDNFAQDPFVVPSPMSTAIGFELAQETSNKPGTKITRAASLRIAECEGWPFPVVCTCPGKQ
jgi:hypothetical protein